MEIFDFAMQMEKEGEALYSLFADACGDKGLASIFKELAAQEQQHFEIFKQMKEGGDLGAQGITSLDYAKSVFYRWKTDKDKFNFKVSQADLYRKALDIEKTSVDFYTENAATLEDEAQKEVMLKIAREEQAHYEVVENIIEFITKPEWWVEHAEFSKIGEEY